MHNPYVKASLYPHVTHVLTCIFLSKLPYTLTLHMCLHAYSFQSFPIPSRYTCAYMHMLGYLIDHTIIEEESRVVGFILYL